MASSSHPIKMKTLKTYNTCLSGTLWGYTTLVIAAVVGPNGARTIAVLVLWNKDQMSLFMMEVAGIFSSYLFQAPSSLLPPIWGTFWIQVFPRLILIRGNGKWGRRTFFRRTFGAKSPEGNLKRKVKWEWVSRKGCNYLVYYTLGREVECVSKISE